MTKERGMTTGLSHFLNLDFSVIVRFREALAWGIVDTLILTLVPAAVGLAVGSLISAAVTARWPAVRWPAVAFCEIWRNTPILVQAIWIHFALPIVTGVSTSPFQSGLITLSLNASAYFSEIIRSGVAAVGRDQFEAAKALGLSLWARWRRVIVPQAIPKILPPLTNSLISLLKATAALSILAVDDLMKVINRLNSVLFRPIELYTSAAAIYILLGVTLGALASVVERRSAASTAR
jgi:polar amino acid transport system permease protein